MTEERRDDEIIGRALSRAIETIDLNQTPYERSRIATAPARRSIFGVWQIAGALVAIVLAVAIGSWFTRPTEGQPGVAASQTPAPSSSASSGPTASPAPTTGERVWVYFARDGLPPVGAFVNGTVTTAQLTATGRINWRLASLWAASADQAPAGTTNAMRLVGRTSGSPALSTNAAINGDLATVDLNVSDWNVRGAAQSQALLQQLVYTATEEPGVRRVLITQNGKPAVIDQVAVNTSLSREDVSGYAGPVPSGQASTITSGGGSTKGLTLTTSYSVDSLAPGLARFVVTITDPKGAPVADVPFSAYLDTSSQPDLGKAAIILQVGTEPNAATGVTVVDRSPLRSIAATNSFGSPTTTQTAAFVVGLDDARPWRVFTLSNPARIVLDIGGAPQAVSDRIAVYAPSPGTTIDGRISRTFAVTGAARVFEANVSWRLKDSSGREVASGHFLASLGSSAVWGTFDTRIAIPASVSGNVTLELFEASAKDGSPQGVVEIPLAVR